MANVLVIDDEPIVRDLVSEILAEDGHEVRTAATAEDALAALDDHNLGLVVSDIVMPGLSGLELLATVRRLRPNLPVVLVTGRAAHGTVSAALAEGADGLVLKPFSQIELSRTVAAALRRTALRTEDVRDRLLPLAVASVLTNAIETRDGSLEGHCERLADLAVRIGEECGLGEAELEILHLGALLHDVGKIGVPDRVLTKLGALTLEERALLRMHPLVGDRLLEPLAALADVRPIVRHHHERWDGGGYPDGLAGREIPLSARIIAVADSVEAMSAERSYRTPLARGRILAELERGRGAQWDPALVDVVVRLIETGALTFARDGLALTLAVEVA
jgi:putative two-component system response regulator